MSMIMMRVTMMNITMKVLMNMIIRAGFAEASTLVGAPAVAKYFTVTFHGLTRYLVHGIPEIVAYFIAGLAGGIISVAVVKHDFFSKKFNQVMADSSDLILIALGVVLLAAVLEAYVTPLIFH